MQDRPIDGHRGIGRHARIALSAEERPPVAPRTGVDEVILRAITAEDTLDAYLRFVEQARELL